MYNIFNKDSTPTDITLGKYYDVNNRFYLSMNINVGSIRTAVTIKNKHDVMKHYPALINMMFSQYDSNNIPYTRVDIIRAVANMNKFIDFLKALDLVAILRELEHPSNDPVKSLLAIK